MMFVDIELSAWMNRHGFHDDHRECPECGSVVPAMPAMTSQCYAIYCQCPVCLTNWAVLTARKPGMQVHFGEIMP